MPQTLGTIRTRFGFYSQELEPALGTTLQPTTDPEGAPIPPEALKAIRLSEGFTPLPATLWEAFRDLCFSYVNWDAKGVDISQEVAVIWTRRGEKLEEWEGWVPTQEVGGGFVDSDLRLPLVNLMTGERMESLTAIIASGRKHAGSSHSHNTFGAFFSGTDDKAELSMPGLHCVLGKIRRLTHNKHVIGMLRYNIAPSIVMQGKRYESVITENGTIRAMLASDVIEADGLNDGYEGEESFHADVHTVVTVKKYVPAISTAESDVTGDGWKGRVTYPKDWEGSTVALPETLTTENILHVSLGTSDRTKCWVRVKGDVGLKYVEISRLPDGWRRALNETPQGASAPITTTAAPYSARVGLFRAGKATNLSEAWFLSDMIAATLKDGTLPDGVRMALTGALAKEGILLHTAPADAGTVATPVTE